MRGALTFDPAVRHAIEPSVALVSVLDADAMKADAWATAFSVLGPDAGTVLADARDVAMRMLVRRGTGCEERISRKLCAMMGGDL